MKNPALVARSLAALLLFSGMAVAAQESKINFNPDWKFIRADPAGARDPTFDDSSWTAVSLPHTYNDIGTFDDWSTPNHVGEMNLWSGRTWYRKTFTLPQTMQCKKVFIEFEAVRQIAEVYLNGQPLGTSGRRVSTEVARAGGEVDGVRLPKAAYYVVRTIFRDDPQVHIIGHWTYPANTKKTVYVTSNAQDVELLVNGKSLYAKATDRYLFTFPGVVWEPGEIKAIASTDGRVAATESKHTVGPAVALRMTALSVEPG
jgi:hypothetical protein